MAKLIDNLKLPFAGNKNMLATVILFVVMLISGGIIMLISNIREYLDGAEERAAVKAVKAWYAEKGETPSKITLSSRDMINVADYDADIERNLAVNRILRENLEMLLDDNGALIPEFVEGRSKIEHEVLENSVDSLTITATKTFLKYIDLAAAEPFPVFKANVEYELQRIADYEKTYNEPNAYIFVFHVDIKKGKRDLVSAIRLFDEKDYKISELSPLLPDMNR